MKVAELLEQRRANWRELDALCARLEVGSSRPAWGTVSRFAALYRAACADLALADAYQLPPNTIAYLHQLVGRAHNRLYRSLSFRVATWARTLFVTLPRQMFRDGYLRLAFVIFWGVFLAAGVVSYQSPPFAEAVLGAEMIEAMEQMHADAHTGRGLGTGGLMMGFYVWHNTGIGLQCFACGLLLGVGGLLITISNAAILGSVFGHMATVENPRPFFEFVTAHGPFELTAIVLAAGAGMRLGFSIVDTRGLTRLDSLTQAARTSLPQVCVSAALFGMAAVIEGFISPSGLPYPIKAIVAVLSTALLLFYFLFLGYPRDVDA